MTPVVPLLLQSDNVTPPTRTPWGGTRLGDGLKTGLRGRTIGESWELSVEPDFPSRVGDAAGPLLDSLIRESPDRWLGHEHHRGRPSTALLLKLLDTAEALSVQIHPADDEPSLAPHESGKPESWYILDRQPGAGLYLGLASTATRARFEQTLRAEGAVDELLSFVPVEPGDFFVIDAGTPHAIGAGVTLIEPQRVLPGKRGVTYRYWDWNRRYDDAGRPSPSGTPRRLHVEAALAVTRWRDPRGEALLDAVRIEDRPNVSATATRRPLAGKGGLFSTSLRVDRISGTGTLPFTSDEHLWGLTVVQGSATLSGPSGFSLTVPAGRTAAIPACFQGALSLESCLATVAAAL